MWKGIATTKSRKNEENVYLKSSLMSNRPDLLPQHVSISLREFEEHINKQLNEHKCLMYGRFDFIPSAIKNVARRKTTISGSNNKKVVNYNSLNGKGQSQGQDEENNSIQDEEIFEQEVDELLNWTKNI